MGNIFSTRWFGSRKKRLVEACLSLDSGWFARMYHWSAETETHGTLTWIDPETGALRGGCTFDAATWDVTDAWLILRAQDTNTGQPVQWAIELTTTRPTFGGLRWWFLCGGQGGHGTPCRRRVRTLYLPPGSRFFGCRACHRLTYRSCQEAHKFDRGAYAELAHMQGITPAEMHARMTARRPAG